MAATTVARDVTEEFVEALRRLEQSGDVDEMAALFTQDGCVWTPVELHMAEGIEAIRSFWRRYHDAFSAVQTDFVHTIRQGDDVCLEWTSCVVPKNARDAIEYPGVTLLRVEGGHIREMRSYFDTRPFLPPGRAKTPGA